jgi:hypothetical protein
MKNAITRLPVPFLIIYSRLSLLYNTLLIENFTKNQYHIQLFL